MREFIRIVLQTIAAIGLCLTFVHSKAYPVNILTRVILLLLSIAFVVWSFKYDDYDYNEE